MSSVAAFVTLGFRHIVNPDALDHMLFLLALAAIYRLRDLRAALAVITAFTVGHSLTLALAATNVIVFPPRIVEFLIPLTIVATCVENIAVSRTTAVARRWQRPAIAGVFGLVHGAGFADYLRGLFVSDVVVPLFGFNVGIELGQLVVLAFAALALAFVDRGIAAARAPRTAWSPLRIRIVAVSALVFIVASRWAVERAPWY